MMKTPQVFLASLLIGGCCLYTATAHGASPDPFEKLWELVKEGGHTSQEIILGPNSGGTIDLPKLDEVKSELKDISSAELEKLRQAANTGYKPEGMMKLAVGLQLQGKTEEAKSTYEKLIFQYPAGLETYKGLLEIYEQSADQAIHIFVNGKEISFETSPRIMNGTTLVPIRAVSEALGADVSWNGTTRKAVIDNGDTTLALNQDNAEALSNGRKVKLEVPAQNINGSILVPIRFVSEQFEMNVNFVSKGSGPAIIPITSK